MASQPSGPRWLTNMHPDCCRRLPECGRGPTALYLAASSCLVIFYVLPLAMLGSRVCRTRPTEAAWPALMSKILSIVALPVALPALTHACRWSMLSKTVFGLAPCVLKTQPCTGAQVPVVQDMLRGFMRAFFADWPAVRFGISSFVKLWFLYMYIIYLSLRHSASRDAAVGLSSMSARHTS